MVKSAFSPANLSLKKGTGNTEKEILSIEAIPLRRKLLSVVSVLSVVKILPNTAGKSAFVCGSLNVDFALCFV